MTSRLSLLAAATPVWPGESPCLLEAPTHNPCAGSSLQGEGAGHRWVCESMVGSTFGGQAAGGQAAQLLYGTAVGTAELESGIGGRHARR